MQKSFRQILEQHMRPQAPTESRRDSATPAANPYVHVEFHWQAPPQMAAFKYPRSARPTPSPAPEPAAEKVRALSELSDSEQFLVQRLIRYGATELTKGLGLTGLRKAYRRLAKRLHPDVSPGTALQFMEVKKAYEELVKACV